MKTSLKLIALAIFLNASTVFGQSSGHPVADDPTVSFVSKAADGGQTEIMMGKLAAKKAQRADIKAFGTRMVNDHTKANAQLMALVRNKSIPLGVKKAMDGNKMLSNVSGAAFDREYVKMMIKDHEMSVALFQKAAATLKDDEVKAFAQKNLPILKQHLATITAIGKQMNITK
jgi:putative membrane protein